MGKEGQPRSTIAFLVIAVLVVSVVALVVASTQRPAAPSSSTNTMSTTASTSQGSETMTTSQSSTSESSTSSAATTSSSLYRIPDIQNAYEATVSSSVTTSSETNATDTCAALGSGTGQCVGTVCPPSTPSSSGHPPELQVVSDTTGMPVQQGAPAVSAALVYGCHGINIDVKVTLYFDRVSEGSSGWFDPPSVPGAYNFTVAYAGHTYSFPAGSYQASTTCVKLSVPSGLVTLTSYEFSSYDCAGDLGGWAGGDLTYAFFGEVYLRVLSDSDSALVAGAAVTTAYDCECGATGLAFKSFTTTTHTEWYVFGDHARSFSVIYGGEGYNVTASQRASSVCVALHVPSGAVDTIYGAWGAGCNETGSSNSTAAQSSTTSASTTTVTSSSSRTCPSTSSSSTASSTRSGPSILDAEVANVTLTPWPGQIGVNPVTGKVYVSDLCANTLTVLNASNYAVVRTITLPGTPTSGIAVDPEKDMVYVPVSGCTNLPNVSNSCDSPGGGHLTAGIVRIAGSDDTIAGEFPIDVQRLAIDPTRQVLYGVSNASVSSLGVDYLYKYDENSGAMLSDSPLSATPVSIAVDPQSNTVFMSACSSMSYACGNEEVLAVNYNSHNEAEWTPWIATNFPLVFDSTNNAVYVMGETGGNLTLNAIDGSSPDNLLYSVSLGSSCAGAGGGGMVVDTTTNRLYVLSDGENCLLVIDGSNGKLVATFSTPLSMSGHNVGLNPATHEVYLTVESSSHPNTGYFVVLSDEGLNRTS